MNCLFCSRPLAVHSTRMFCSKSCEKSQLNEDTENARIDAAGRLGLFETIRGGLMKLNLGLSDEPTVQL